MKMKKMNKKTIGIIAIAITLLTSLTVVFATANIDRTSAAENDTSSIYKIEETQETLPEDTIEIIPTDDETTTDETTSNENVSKNNTTTNTTNNKPASIVGKVDVLDVNTEVENDGKDVSSTTTTTTYEKVDAEVVVEDVPAPTQKPVIEQKKDETKENNSTTETTAQSNVFITANEDGTTTEQEIITETITIVEDSDISEELDNLF